MNEIKCPKCSEIFKVDQASYSDIVKQVRDDEFSNELAGRVDDAKKLAAAEFKAAEQELRRELNRMLDVKERKILELQVGVNNFATEKELAITQAVNEVAKERDALNYKLETTKISLRDKYETEIKSRDDMIERLKDLKAKLSNKMAGETLEQHCQNEFDSVRAWSFPNAEFMKDNDASGGTKGDYIFRDSIDGVEYISIMFEMKNEFDTTATKQKNEDFFDKLNKDRISKNCEYAVLVSLLESENELYNKGIVDVSHKFSKMFVIRPQFFLPLIGLLSNAARGTLEYKRELALMRNQNVDITNFEGELNAFQDEFGKRYGWAKDRFNDAIKNIDKSISQLQEMRENLIKSDDHLRIANQKAQDLTIKKLTHNNPTMAAKFAEISALEGEKV